MAVLTKADSDLIANLNGRLPSTPDEIREAIRLGEDDVKAGSVVPAEEVIKGLERIRAKHAQSGL